MPFVLASALLTSALAQDDGSASEEEIFELSPFTINSAEDTGYRAKNTLSGSRLKVSLDDVATPLDIITPELMEDFAVTDIDGLMNIVSNVEEGDNLFFDSVYSNGSSYKIRGFYNVTQLRNFLGGRMPFDSYNSTRLVAAKGPNAILYGTGPAGGALSYFTKQHHLGSKDTTNASVQLDNWGTLRTTFDTDRSIIDGKLGFHLSWMHEDREYEIKPDYQIKNGYYLGVKYAPFQNTTISATYERRDEEAFRGTGNFTAMQDHVSAWIDGGQVLALDSNSIIHPDGMIEDGVNIKNYGIYWNNARRNRQHTVSDDGTLLNWGRKTLSDLRPALSSHQTDRRFQSPYWPRDINPTGVNGGAYVDQEAWDMTIEQKVNDNFYLMAVFGENNMDREQYQMRIRNHYVDTNYY
ncbi:TonB-dependent receptor plug domain-containing protein, partial [Pelagicoccus enzymogenes]|uniref:TonB-dependent receptor plug domain-containing protein n=1 Tax=Pelagicoccus enzymogenes TaxID=2773457 RepID=UPI002811E500